MPVNSSDWDSMQTSCHTADQLQLNTAWISIILVKQQDQYFISYESNLSIKCKLLVTWWQFILSTHCISITEQTVLWKLLNFAKWRNVQSFPVLNCFKIVWFSGFVWYCSTVSVMQIMTDLHIALKLFCALITLVYFGGFRRTPKKDLWNLFCESSIFVIHCWILMECMTASK